MTIGRLISYPAFPPQMDTPVGRICCLTAPGPLPLDYYLYNPTNVDETAPLLVAIHGISRNAFEQVRHFAPLAEAYGIKIIAPHFREGDYRGYQSLGLDKGQLRADKAFHGVMDDLLTRGLWKGGRFFTFGFSGGAQFVHRYAMAYPSHIAGMTLGAAGWYTMPDETAPYPYGMALKHDDIMLNLPAYLDIPCHIVVGQKDTRRDKALNKTKMLDTHQGRNRLTRAENFTSHMRAKARAMGKAPLTNLTIIDKAGHSFARAVQAYGLDQLVFNDLLNTMNRNGESK